MAFAPHYRVSFGGTLAEGVNGDVDEIWACNINVTPASGNTFDVEAYLDQMSPALKGWFGAGQNGLASDSTLDYVKVNQVGADGKYVDPTFTHRRDYTPGVVGGASPVNPQILSVCLSWVTGKLRGPGSHGRIYPPNMTFGTATGMLIPQADQDKAAAAGVKLLQTLNNASNSPFRPGPLASYIIGIPVVSSAINGTNTPIIACRVGNVKDVQRRRKNALRETYRTGVFLAATS